MLLTGLKKPILLTKSEKGMVLYNNPPILQPLNALCPSPLKTVEQTFAIVNGTLRPRGHILTVTTAGAYLASVGTAGIGH